MKSCWQRRYTGTIYFWSLRHLSKVAVTIYRVRTGERNVQWCWDTPSWLSRHLRGRRWHWRNKCFLPWYPLQWVPKIWREVFIVIPCKPYKQNHQWPTWGHKWYKHNRQCSLAIWSRTTRDKKTHQKRTIGRLSSDFSSLWIKIFPILTLGMRSNTLCNKLSPGDL